MSTFELISPEIEAYCEAHTTEESDLLYRLNRQTHLQTINPRMASGQLQGQFLSLISNMIVPKRILEIGTFTGYSALCLATGLTSDGMLHTIEINEEYEDRIRAYFAESPYNQQITLHIGDAKTIVPSLDVPWDLVFIDAEKTDYQEYYELVFPQVKKNGFILIDNTLWNSKVVCEVHHNDKDTQAILAFNDMVQHDGRVRNLLLPFRDGIMIIEKIQG
ncbi:MAG: class I SAM-dependent methyltransferase [Bacteroidales bacterium]|nr:class I SAM-dependent methyltransferase [Bacteroidales bacterium]